MFPSLSAGLPNLAGNRLPTGTLQNCECGNKCADGRLRTSFGTVATLWGKFYC
jgi:hypothetical protein